MDVLHQQIRDTASAVVRLLPRPEPPHAEQTIAARVQRLQAETRTLALGHVGDLMASMFDMIEQARAIADGGEAYPAGARNEARLLADSLKARVLNLSGLMERVW